MSFSLWHINTVEKRRKVNETAPSHTSSQFLVHDSLLLCVDWKSAKAQTSSPATTATATASAQQDSSSTATGTTLQAQTPTHAYVSTVFICGKFDEVNGKPFLAFTEGQHSACLFQLISSHPHCDTLPTAIAQLVESILSADTATVDRIKNRLMVCFPQAACTNLKAGL